MNIRATPLAVLLGLISVPAFAACPSPLTAKDASGTTQNLGTQNDPNNYCILEGSIWGYDGLFGAAVNSSHLLGIQAPPSLPLPTGAATAAKQPALGTAGTPSADVLSVQGEASMTPFKVDGSAVTQPASLASGSVASGAYAAGSIASGAAVAGAFADGAITTLGAKTDAKNAATDTTSVSAIAVLKEISSLEQAPASRAVTNAGTFAVQAAESGTWNITNISGTVSLPTGAATSANQTNASQKTQIVDGSGNVIASTSNNLNVQCANCSGSGASATDEASFTAGTSVFAPFGGFYQTTATSNPLVSGQQGFAQLTINRALQVNLRNSVGVEEGNSTTPLQVSLANTATNATAVKVDPSGVTSPVNPLPSTSGGLTAFFVQPGASDNHANIKNGAGQVYHVAVTNNSATINYLRLYNAATGFNGCNSATNLVYQLAIPATPATSVGAGFVEDISQGIAFSTGISICVTSGYATTDTTSATASAMSVMVGYK